MAADMVQGDPSAASQASSSAFTHLRLVSGEHVYVAGDDHVGLTCCTVAVPNSTWPGYSGSASKCRVHGFAQETSVRASYIVSCLAYPGSFYALTLHTMADLSRKKCPQPSQTAKSKLQGRLDVNTGRCECGLWHACSVIGPRFSRDGELCGVDQAGAWQWAVKGPRICYSYELTTALYEID